MTINFSHIADVQFVLDRHKAVKLLRKQHASLIIAFLWSAFKAVHRQAYGSREITTLLSDFLFSANEEEVHYSKEPRMYLEEWTQEGFLRQFYENNEEEATFELTPATEHALLWITELDKREFVGAESRLLQVFQLLRELALGSTQDKEVRLEQLLQRRQELDQEILAIENDEVGRLDPTRIRERYALIEETSSKLLSDFRQIEDNFRQLNTRAREEQITRQSSRGEVLDEIFSAQDSIMETDQGKTFNAFWAFLMNQQRQDELDQLVRQVFEQPELSGYRNRSVVPRLKMSLVEAGDRVNKTTDRLVEQLRRFLVSRTFLENRRASQVIEEIEQLALKVKNDPPTQRNFIAIEGKPAIHLLMERDLFQPPDMLRLDSENLAFGNAEEVTVDGLYEQLYIDPAELKGRIKALLRGRDQISLRQITEEVPVEKGLSELVAYFGIATALERQQKAIINEEKIESIVYHKDGHNFKVDLPQTLFLA
ncbi:MAG: hypothetical protein DHS20C18_14110 [Saprospiraceae bacterium]|nr:MAG: hypothetical protein DHS20C18_14110 [Saprospiraceae bacterium]